MSYLLYFNDNVYGCYSKAELLRSNILIIVFELLEKSQIGTTKYENIVNYLTVSDFTIDNFDIDELKNELRGLKIRIEKDSFFCNQPPTHKSVNNSFLYLLENRKRLNYKRGIR